MKMAKKKNIYTFSVFVAAILMIIGCASSKKKFNPDKKYSPKQLQSDYTLFRKILEESHPGLYWYTSKDSMNRYFDSGYARITDSMTEPQFRALLSYVIAKINCGHTTTKNSKAFNRYLDTVRLPLFPLGVKFLKDTAVITANINSRDSILKPGMVINSINNVPINTVRDSLMQYVSADGYNNTHKRQSISNGFAFGAYYKTAFGQTSNFSVGFTDNANNARVSSVKLYRTVRDSSFRKQMAFTPKPSRKERRRLDLSNERVLTIDTARQTAFLEINTFSAGNRLKHFIKKSFREMKHQGVKHLVIDVRNNGGGDVSNSTLLTKFIVDKKFKLADSLYAVKKTSTYGRYISNSFIVWPFMTFTTRKRKDGLYHFGFYERHYFKPHRHNHFDGDIYILTGGNSFSATTLFAGAVKSQKNVLIVGEETGGGQYGNCAWFIPDVTLPNTKVRFRLPKFRLVIDNNKVKNGHGVMPDVEVVPTTVSIGKGEDLKMAKALELIKAVQTH